MPGYLGIDTSNYTTSAAIYEDGAVIQKKKLLPVEAGKVGLRQSDAVFSHIKALGGIIGGLMEEYGGTLAGIGASKSPRDVEGSYMPCFLVGMTVAESASSLMRLPLSYFSHQAGHIAAALYGAGKLSLREKPFLAFHVSGGTTECLWVENLEAGKITLLFHTNDLNAGQVVDRVGHMLSLPFPAGRELDRLSLGSQKTFRVRPSFQGENPCLSGIENQCVKLVRDGEAPCDVARFCLESILAALDRMVENAIKSTGCETILFAGGVTSNTLIREKMTKKYGGYFAPPEFSCDNAVGTAVLAAMRAGENVDSKG